MRWHSRHLPRKPRGTCPWPFSARFSPLPLLLLSLLAARDALSLVAYVTCPVHLDSYPYAPPLVLAFRRNSSNTQEQTKKEGHGLIFAKCRLECFSLVRGEMLVMSFQRGRGFVRLAMRDFICRLGRAPVRVRAGMFRHTHCATIELKTLKAASCVSRSVTANLLIAP